MAKTSKRPFFLGGDRRRTTYETLVKEADCIINKVNGDVEISIWKPWTDRHKALAHKHAVTAVDLCTSSFGDHETAEFLLDLPWLTSVSIRLYCVKDLTALGRLSDLQSLRISLEVWRLGDQLVHHIIDPATGLPVAPVWRTVSVAAATCVEANAAATAAMVKGANALAWLFSFGLPARLVGVDGLVWRIAGWPADDESPALDVAS